MFDGVLTHVAGIGRLFFNTPFAQPARTRTWHEDHDFPEVVFPFSSATATDPISGATASLLQGDGTDPLLIETNTATEYWQKGASLLHTAPDGTRDAALPESSTRLFLDRHEPYRARRHANRRRPMRHAAQSARPDGRGPRAAGRTGRMGHHGPRTTAQPAAAHRRRLAGARQRGHVPPRHRFHRPSAANDVAPLPDWINLVASTPTWCALVPQVGPDGNELAGLKLPDIAVPRGTHTGWNLYKAPYPAGELADRDGAFLAFAATKAERDAAGDTRPSLAERYPKRSAYTAQIETIVAQLRNDGLLLPEDADAYLARAGS